MKQEQTGRHFAQPEKKNKKTNPHKGTEGAVLSGAPALQPPKAKPSSGEKKKAARILIPVICLAALLCAAIPLGTVLFGQDKGEDLSLPAAFAPLADAEIRVEETEAPAEPLPAPQPEEPSLVAHSTELVLQGREELPLEKEDQSQLVAQLQERLMILYYMGEDEPTSLYGATTEQSVRLFQKKNGLPETGITDEATYDLLFSDQAKVYSVSEGDEGEDVKDLQQRLVELGYLSKATGKYASGTTKAVTKFQKNNKIQADGSIGPATQEALYSAEVVEQKEEKKEDTTAQVSVKDAQKRLIELNYLTGKADGKMGSDTKAAIKRFQEKNGLIADGSLGPGTAQLLMSKDAIPNAYTIGDRGDGVTALQKRLAALGYMSKTTGYYGGETETAVKAFQKRNGLKEDGKAGAKTLKALNSSSAKKADKTSAPAATKAPSAGNNSSGGESTSADPSVERFIQVAKSYLGHKYVWGGKKPGGFDCSGFVYWCLNEAGVKQGYMTSATWQKCTKYPVVNSMQELKRGDVISFKGHVGIYLGNGQMIDASSEQGKVRICKTLFTSSYWKKNFVKGCRIFG